MFTLKPLCLNVAKRHCLTMATILKMFNIGTQAGAQDAIDILDNSSEPNHSCSSETWFNSEQTAAQH